MGCKVCDDKAAALTIDKYLDQGLTFATIARALTLEGFAVGSGVISTHDKHRTKGMKADAKPTKRDASIIIKNKLLDALEQVEQETDPLTGEADGSFILSKHIQPALNTALKAQAIEDKREQKKVTQNFWFELAGSMVQVKALPDPTVVEGDFEVIEPGE